MKKTQMKTFTQTTYLCVQIKSPRRQHILVEIHGTLIKTKTKKPPKNPQKTHILQHKYKPRPFTQKILDNIGSQ